MHPLLFHKKKQKGFTLIELLVVVAIIGILAAIGVATFGGFQGAAKANTVKTNHKTVVNFIAASMANCEIGEKLKLKKWDTWGTFYDTTNICNASKLDLANGFGNHFHAIGFNNPYNNSPSDSPVVTSITSCTGHPELGDVCIFVSDTIFSIETEYKTNEFLRNEISRE